MKHSVWVSFFIPHPIAVFLSFLRLCFFFLYRSCFLSCSLSCPFLFICSVPTDRNLTQSLRATYRSDQIKNTLKFLFYCRQTHTKKGSCMWNRHFPLCSFSSSTYGRHDKQDRSQLAHCDKNKSRHLYFTCTWFLLFTSFAHAALPMHSTTVFYMCSVAIQKRWFDIYRFYYTSQSLA